MVRVISHIASLLAILGCIILVSDFIVKDSITVNVDNSLKSYALDTAIERIDDNHVYTSINGISNTLLNVQSQGFVVDTLNDDGNQIDVVLSREDELRRYSYSRSDRILTYFIVPYESMLTEQSYIISNDVEG